MGLFDFLGRKNNGYSILELAIKSEEIRDGLGMKELALHIAMSTIADLLSRCKIKRYVKGKEAPNEFTFAMNLSPNANMTAAEFWQKVIRNSYECENGAIVIPYERNGFMNYQVADSYAIKKYPMKENKYSGIVIDTLTLNKNYSEGDIFHFNFENIELKKYVEIMYSEYGELMKFALETYKNKNGMKLLLELESVKTGSEDDEKKYKEQLKESMKSFMTSPNAVMPKYKGTSITDFAKGSSQNSDDIRNLRKDIFDTVAQIFKIPQSIFYGNITNSDQVFDEMITLVIAPHAKVIEQELNRKTISYDEYVKGDRIEIDTSTIKVQDILKLSASISGLVGSGAYSPNDVREKLGDAKINEDWANEYYMTKNYANADDISKGVNE